MAWKRGQSGNPHGASKDKAFADAIRMVVSEDCPETGKRKLRRLAERLYEEALKGEGWAMAQIADRLDGKPAQESTVTIDDKRDATDWTRDELVAFLNDRRNGSDGAAKANGREKQPDRVH